MKLKHLRSRKIDMAGGIVPLADIFMNLLLFTMLVSVFAPMGVGFLTKTKKFVNDSEGKPVDYDPTKVVVSLEAKKEELFHLRPNCSEDHDPKWARTYVSVQNLADGLECLRKTFPDRSVLIMLNSEEDMPVRLYYRVYKAVQEAGLDIAWEGLLDENK